MATRRWAGATAAVTIPLALAVQSVLALGSVQPVDATPEAPERREAVDPGFVVRFDGDVDPGFIVEFEDRSNDTGFTVVPGAPQPAPSPSPSPASSTPPAPVITLGAP